MKANIQRRYTFEENVSEVKRLGGYIAAPKGTRLYRCLLRMRREVAKAQAQEVA
jgi:hypothetical protein